ncbi:MAG: cytochrome c [Bryobacterales bacterium]|nr:cytochrome c [Bryobacteraceae bacterium]MDW8131977.1 cytochrome c [Bryobacterales bacterium]
MKKAAILLALALAGCSRTSRNPPIEIIPDMDRQPRFRVQGETPVFADRRMSRPPVPGTIARGQLPEFSLPEGNPLPWTMETLERGRQRYDIYCAPCHDRTGAGRGIVAVRGNWPAGDLRESRLRETSDRDLFDVITNGRRTMPAYRYQIAERDRWAIVAYVRALQRAASGTLADVPPELRDQLR